MRNIGHKRNHPKAVCSMEHRQHPADVSSTGHVENKIVVSRSSLGLIYKPIYANLKTFRGMRSIDVKAMETISIIRCMKYVKIY